MPRRRLLAVFREKDDRMGSTREYGDNAILYNDFFGKMPRLMHLLHRSTHVILACFLIDTYLFHIFVISSKCSHFFVGTCTNK